MQLRMEVAIFVGQHSEIRYSQGGEAFLLKDLDGSSRTLGLMPLFEMNSARELKVVGVIAYLAKAYDLGEQGRVLGVRPQFLFHPDAYGQPYAADIRQRGWWAAIPVAGLTFTLHSLDVWCHCRVETVELSPSGEIGELVLDVYPESHQLLLDAYRKGLRSGVFQRSFVPTS